MQSGFFGRPPSSTQKLGGTRRPKDSDVDWWSSHCDCDGECRPSNGTQQWDWICSSSFIEVTSWQLVASSVDCSRHKKTSWWNYNPHYRRYYWCWCSCCAGVAHKVVSKVAARRTSGIRNTRRRAKTDDLHQTKTGRWNRLVGYCGRDAGSKDGKAEHEVIGEVATWWTGNCRITAESAAASWQQNASCCCWWWW